MFPCACGGLVEESTQQTETGGAGAATTTYSQTSTGGSGGSLIGGSGGTGGGTNTVTFCPMDWGATSTVAGLTPLGEMALPYGWMAFQGGECSAAARIVLSAHPTFDAAQWAQPETPVLNFTSAAGTFSTGYVGEGSTNAYLQVDNTTADVTGWVNLTKVDPLPEGPIPPDQPYPSTEGTVLLDGSGWNVSGNFVVPYCETLNVFCP